MRSLKKLELLFMIYFKNILIILYYYEFSTDVLFI